jgi:hypothetical protein
MLSSLSCLFSFSQDRSKISSQVSGNALLPDKCYIKYIYDFRYESKPVFYSDKFPDLETRNYLNSDLIKPLFDKIFREGYEVSDPNYWGSVENLAKSGTKTFIDTNQILKYMHAGWDTTYSIDIDGNITPVPVYTPPDYSDISGLFFFESWYLNPDKGFLSKEVIAYFPIYEYWDERARENGEQAKLKRLIFMVFQGNHDPKKMKKIMYLYRGVQSELSLYNRPYSFYLHRDQVGNAAGEGDYNEWEYHTFDFYKDFYPEEFLEIIINLALDGRFKAEDPANSGKILTPREILAKVSDEQSNIRYDNLNSVEFNEDWYFNPGSLHICKKINSITVIKHEYQYDEYTGDFLRTLKTPLFVISLK